MKKLIRSIMDERMSITIINEAGESLEVSLIMSVRGKFIIFRDFRFRRKETSFDIALEREVWNNEEDAFYASIGHYLRHQKYLAESNINSFRKFAHSRGKLFI